MNGQPDIIGIQSSSSDDRNKIMKSKLLEELEGEAKWVNIDSFARLFAWGHNSAVALIWSLILPVSIGITLFLIIGTVQQYNEHRVSSTIRYHMENDPFPFPTFLLCSVNPFISNFSRTLLQLANVTMGPDEEADIDKYWRMFMEIESYFISTRGYPMTLDEKYQLTGFSNQTTDTVIFIGLLKSLTRLTLKLFFHPKYFNCLVYNTDGRAMVDQAYNSFDFMTFFTSRIPMFDSRFKVYYLFVQNQSDFLLGEDRVPILLDENTFYMYISRKFYKQYPSPYSNCGVGDDLSLAVDLPDRFLFDQVIKLTGTYTQKSCFLFCTQQLTNKLCGCQSNRIAYNITGAAYCPMQRELTCAYSVANYGLSANISTLFDDQCRANCPLECSRMFFNVKMQNNGEDLYMAYFTAAIYMSDTAYVELVEEPVMDGWSLLGILGGHCHLLLGMSLASFLELGEFILIALARSLANIRRPSSTRLFGPLRTQATLLKMGYIPSAVRSSYKLASMFWTGMFLTSAGVCIYLVRQTALDFLSYQVTSTVSRIHDLSSTQVNFCNQNLFLSDYALNLLRENNLTEMWQLNALFAIENASLQTRGQFLTNAELARLMEINRTVISCSLNDRPCEFEFNLIGVWGCYTVKRPKTFGNIFVYFS